MRPSGTLLHVGEGFAGEGAHAAHVNIVLGHRAGPVSESWVTALATPREGHVPFVAVARPGVPVRPFTLFVNKATVEGERHGVLTWGAAQAGVAAGTGAATKERLLPRDLDSHLVIAAVWVDPAATDEEAVFANNSAATLAAFRMIASGGPSAKEALAAMLDPANPYFRRD